MNRTQFLSLGASIPERRPMFTREWELSRWLTDWLVRKRVSPNAISLAGLAAGIAAGAALAMSAHSALGRIGFAVAAVAIVLRGMANVLDGMVAVQRGTASPVGELFNEVPDRVSDTAILIGAGYALGSWPLLGFSAALAAVLTA